MYTCMTCTCTYYSNVPNVHTFVICHVTVHFGSVLSTIVSFCAFPFLFFLQRECPLQNENTLKQTLYSYYLI